jgi:hypothetical protein
VVEDKEIVEEDVRKEEVDLPPPQELSPPPKVPEVELSPVPQVPHADLPAAPTAPNNTAQELPGVVFPDGEETQEKERSRDMSGFNILDMGFRERFLSEGR